MLKLYRRFRPIDWVLTVIILALTVLQVFMMMQMIDVIAELTTSIQYIGYNNSPADLYDVLIQMNPGIPSSLKDANTVAEWLAANPGSPLEEILAPIAAVTTNDIWRQGGIMLAYAIGQTICQVGTCTLAAYISSNMATNIRHELNERISHFSLGELNRFSTPSLVTRATNDIQQVQLTNLLLMRMIFVAPVMIIWAICKLEDTSWELTLATAIAVIILIIGLATIMFLAIPKFKIMQKLTDRLNGITQENLSGIRVVRAYNAEKYQENKFAVANEKLTSTQLFTGRITGLLSPLMTLVMNGLTLAIYWIGASLINAQEIDYGSVMSFTMLASQIIMSFLMLLMMFVMLPRAQVCAQRINEVLDTKDSIVDPEVETAPDESLAGTIEFRDVSFRYPDAEENMLEHISFQAKPGQTIAFIGSTGSGKSTLINLVARLYDVTEGQILVDGVDIRQMKQETLHHRVGFVPQRGLLFSGTVRSNIAFGDPTLSDDRVQEAAKIACADEFIQQMEGGYDAPIARGGTNVSGGQRQRLCIARAVATQPEILVFDDSFSALDYRTDKRVRENLAQSQSRTTKLIVAQRIGTIMDADLIIVLSDGKVVGQGTHRELLDNCEIYREIALSQLSREELGL